MSRSDILGGALVALTLIFAVTAFDHGLRKIQQAECERTDVECPSGLWWFS